MSHGSQKQRETAKTDEEPNGFAKGQPRLGASIAPVGENREHGYGQSGNAWQPLFEIQKALSVTSSVFLGCFQHLKHLSFQRHSSGLCFTWFAFHNSKQEQAVPSAAGSFLDPKISCSSPRPSGPFGAAKEPLEETQTCHPEPSRSSWEFCWTLSM